jgi:hypothetical protein
MSRPSNITIIKNVERDISFADLPDLNELAQ